MFKLTVLYTDSSYYKLVKGLAACDICKQLNIAHKSEVMLVSDSNIIITEEEARLLNATLHNHLYLNDNVEVIDLRSYCTSTQIYKLIIPETTLIDYRDLHKNGKNDTPYLTLTLSFGQIYDIIIHDIIKNR